MKSYTDIEQSHKLAELLPLESADHHYVRKVTDFMDNPVDGEWSHPKYGNPNSKYANYIVQNFTSYEKLPCWSIAALVNILPYKIKLSHDVIDANGNPAYKNECYKFSINRCGLFGDKWNVQYYGKHQRQLGKRYKELYIDLLFSENYNNLIDACYEMILKLHKQKLL